MENKLQVITKSVMIQNEEYVLVKITNSNNKSFFGTISYNDINENGRLKRQLDGFEMGLSETPAKAIEFRNDIINTRDMDEQQTINYFIRKVRA